MACYQYSTAMRRWCFRYRINEEMEEQNKEAMCVKRSAQESLRMEVERRMEGES